MLSKHRQIASKNQKQVAGLSSQKIDNILLQTTTSATHLEALTLFTKQYENRVVLSNTLKYSQVFINTFVGSHFEVFELVFASEDMRPQILEVIKRVQKSTRQLQAICQGGKTLKDASMMRTIPRLRALLETLIIRTKSMVTAHGCGGTFHAANLKQKKINGDEIRESEDEDESSGGEGGSGEGGSDGDGDGDSQGEEEESTEDDDEEE